VEVTSPVTGRKLREKKERKKALDGAYFIVFILTYCMSSSPAHLLAVVYLTIFSFATLDVLLEFGFRTKIRIFTTLQRIFATV